jgi:signal transduction histidine kinase
MSAARSITRRLFWRLSVLIGVAGLAMVMAAVWVMDREVNRAADADLEAAARTLSILMDEELEYRAPTRNATGSVPPLSAEDIQAFRTIAEAREFAVLRDGRTLFRSDRRLKARKIGGPDDFLDFKARGAPWRRFALDVPRYNVRIVVAEPIAVRTELVHKTLVQLLSPFTGLLLGAWLMLWLALKAGLGDLRRLTAVLSNRSHNDLAPLPPDDWGQELHGLIEAINQGFERVRRAFQHEQLFTASAAHRLRTPLATVRLQGQMLLRDASPGQRNDVLEMLSAVERASNSVEQGLRLARLDATEIVMAPLDTRILVGEVVADHLVLAAEAGVEVEVIAAPEIVMSSDPVVLALALTSLIENAIRHAADGGEVTVHVVREADDIHFHVLDRGPGIPPAALQKARHPFNTLGGATGGHGLGLTIAIKAVEMLGGRCRVGPREDGQGLAAVLDVPVARNAAPGK